MNKRCAFTVYHDIGKPWFTWWSFVTHVFVTYKISVLTQVAAEPKSHDYFRHWAITWTNAALFVHGPLARFVKLRVAHVPGMPGTFFPLPRVSDPDMHQGTCVTYVPWCMPGSLTSGFIWNRWRIKRSRHSRRMRNPRLYVSGKRPIGILRTTFSNV